MERPALPAIVSPKARYPRGKGEVCKTFMRRFDPGPRLQSFQQFRLGWLRGRKPRCSDCLSFLTESSSLLILVAAIAPQVGEPLQIAPYALRIVPDALASGEHNGAPSEFWNGPRVKQGSRGRFPTPLLIERAESVEATASAVKCALCSTKG